jgi:hypothetical protein
VRSGKFWTAWRGVAEDYQGNKYYDAVVSDERAINRIRVEKRQSPRALRGWLASIVIWSLYTPPKLSLDLGQSQSSLFYLFLVLHQLVLVLLGYLTTLLVCILKDSELTFNSNRAGTPHTSNGQDMFALQFPQVS